MSKDKYFDGAFRTPKIDEALAHNALKAKEKGLLIEKQPDNVLGKVPFRSGKGTYFEHLFAFLKVLEGIVDSKTASESDIFATSFRNKSERKPSKKARKGRGI